MNYVYIVECSDGTFYTGWTTDINRRIIEHNEGKGAKYTRGRNPIILKHLEEYDTKRQAMKRECEIKKLSREQKIELINAYKD
ncbi:GIY-YIG nuclease family protein [Brassicibacter mesophilus]|uniref:GIY-YIG nuclease family protein n=1 Tax=Brassicibacter mesophilus TaxID=745119 RepID=UPI003D1D622B